MNPMDVNVCPFIQASVVHLLRAPLIKWSTFPAVYGQTMKVDTTAIRGRKKEHTMLCIFMLCIYERFYVVWVDLIADINYEACKVYN